MKTTIASILVLTSLLCFAWPVQLPPGTVFTLPIRNVEVKSVDLPLPGGDTNTVVVLGYDREAVVSTNGVSATVVARANIIVSISRPEIEAATGKAVGSTEYNALTNAVTQIAFTKLSSSLPAIAEAIASP